MIFWRIVDNKFYEVDDVNKLGFEQSDGLRIPDDYLENQKFMILRTAWGIGDWGIISAMPRLLKQKYPNCKVYVPSKKLIKNMFGVDSEVVETIFTNNPYVDNFKDYMVGEIFHDHYRIYDNNNKIAFVYFNITLIILITTWVIDVNSNYIYIIPLCIIPLLFKAFFDSRIAFFIHSVTVMLLGFVVPNSYEFIFLNIIAGVVTILTSDNIYKRANLFIAVAQITLVYMLAYFSFYVIQEGNIENLELNNFALFILCGLLTLFIYPLIYIYEKMFGLVSDVSLLELSDTNSSLLKELSDKAPGTFHHSLNVANLAEACANEINANALLSRVGALHHDIGKISNPSFFTENQLSEQNPHDKITSKESVEIIKQHVLDGVKLARNAGIPERIIEFIKTHHGTNLIGYFYNKEIASNPEINKLDFRYDGPKPFSVEMALVMMCDSVEAATKSLDKPDNDKIDSFVESIIDKQVEDEQFENCELTFKNISIIKSVLKEKLKNIYHVRLSYSEGGN